MNKVFLIGNLARDPELRNTTNGIPVCTFSLAVSRRFKSANGTNETDFLNIVVWRGQAESCAKYLKKGSKAAVSGSIQNRNYEVDGVKKYATDIVADEVQFLSNRSFDSAESVEVDSMETAEIKESKAPVGALEPVEEDLPF